MNNSYASWRIYIHYGEMLYLWQMQHTQSYMLKIVGAQAANSVFLGFRHTVGSCFLLLTGFEGWFYWLPSVPAITRALSPGLQEHVARSRRQARLCRDTFYALLAHMQRTRPLWEVLGGCRLFVASGDWSYSVWRDVTCSPTPHDGDTQTLLAHTCTQTHTFAFSLCFSPGWSELFISLSTSAASREMLSLGHYK